MQPVRDFIRREWFGALYFSQRKRAYLDLHGDEAELVVQTALSGEPATVTYSRIADDLSIPPGVADMLILQMREDQLLDRSLRCTAVVLDNPGRIGLLSSPLVLHVQLTQRCNQKCQHCFVDVTEQPGDMSVGDYDRLFAQAAAAGSANISISGGEPLTREDLFEILACLAPHGLQARLFSNGTLVTREKARRLAALPLTNISVSVDSISPEIHDAIRGTGSHGRAIRGIRHLLEAGCPRVQMRLTLHRENLGAIDDLASFARELGVHRVSIKPFRQAGHAAHGKSLAIARDDYFSGVIALAQSWPEEDFPPLAPVAVERHDLATYLPSFGCPAGHTVATVTADGLVRGCGFFEDEQSWNLRDHTLTDCWLNDPTLEAWRKLMASPECRECAELERCHGGCRARAVGSGGSMSDPDPWAPCACDDPSTALASF